LERLPQDAIGAQFLGHIEVRVADRWRSRRHAMMRAAGLIRRNHGWSQAFLRGMTEIVMIKSEAGRD